MPGGSGALSATSGLPVPPKKRVRSRRMTVTSAMEVGIWGRNLEAMKGFCYTLEVGTPPFKTGCFARWWQLKYFLISALIGEGFHIDYFFQIG